MHPALDTLRKIRVAAVALDSHAFAGGAPEDVVAAADLATSIKDLFAELPTLGPDIDYDVGRYADEFRVAAGKLLSAVMRGDYVTGHNEARKAANVLFDDRLKIIQRAAAKVVTA